MGNRCGPATTHNVTDETVMRMKEDEMEKPGILIIDDDANLSKTRVVREGRVFAPTRGAAAP